MLQQPMVESSLLFLNVYILTIVNVKTVPPGGEVDGGTVEVVFIPSQIHRYAALFHKKYPNIILCFMLSIVPFRYLPLRTLREWHWAHT